MCAPSWLTSSPPWSRTRRTRRRRPAHRAYHPRTLVRNAGRPLRSESDSAARPGRRSQQPATVECRLTACRPRDARTLLRPLAPGNRGHRLLHGAAVAVHRSAELCRREGPPSDSSRLCRGESSETRSASSTAVLPRLTAGDRPGAAAVAPTRKAGCGRSPPAIESFRPCPCPGAVGKAVVDLAIDQAVDNRLPAHAEGAHRAQGRDRLGGFRCPRGLFSLTGSLVGIGRACTGQPSSVPMLEEGDPVTCCRRQPNLTCRIDGPARLPEHA